MKRLNAADSKKLQDEGWAYVDVRSEQEFESGHPAGAVNVPFNAPNFVDLFKAKFPAKDAKLIIGCQVGGRSARASALLEGQGYSELADNTGGFDEWSAKKLPAAKGKS
jgi:rhodanese-related sulfurtransferase